jgi:hypothetical protein
MLSKNFKNIASLIHISTFAKYIFPFGNYIAPLIIWTSNKDRDNFIDDNGKQVLNFQISLFLYFIIMLLICIPVVINLGFNIAELEALKTSITTYDLTAFAGSIITFVLFVIVSCILFIIDLYATIMGAIKASEGLLYNYPLAIKFIK